MEVISDSFANSNLTISQVVNLKLNEKNYLLWKTQLESFLSSQMLLGFVTGDTPKPSPTLSVRTGEAISEASNPEFVKWVRSDQLVKAWIFGSLSENSLRCVYGLSTAHEVWVALAKRYNRISPTRRLELQRRIQSITKQNKSMSTYLSEIKDLCDQLDSIGVPMSEHEKIYGVLNGLGRDYESICTVIENLLEVYPNLCLDDVEYKLIGFEDKLQAYEISTSVSPHQAFYASRGGYSNRGRGGNRGSFRGRGSYTIRGRGFHQQISQSSSQFSSSDGDIRPVCQICGKIGHHALKCWHQFDKGYQDDGLPQAMTAMRIMNVSDSTGYEWFPDTGASAHVTSSSANLQQSQPYHGSDSVMIGDGTFLPITHTGSTSIASSSGTLPLKDVLVCPDIAKSLLSVSKLTKDYPCIFEFDCDAVRVLDKETKKVLVLGNTTNGLYSLEDNKYHVYYSSRQHSTSDEVWHRRLGHLNPQILQLLSSSKAISINKLTKKTCEACQLGKSSRLSFSPSVFVASRPLERIHCDLWGPSPVKSVQGFQYYAVFIDNFSRYSWLFPLKNKSDFFSVFVMFHNLVEN